MDKRPTRPVINVGDITSEHVQVKGNFYRGIVRGVAVNQEAGKFRFNLQDPDNKNLMARVCEDGSRDGNFPDYLILELESERPLSTSLINSKYWSVISSQLYFSLIRSGPSIRNFSISEGLSSTYSILERKSSTSFSNKMPYFPLSNTSELNEVFKAIIIQE